MQQIEITLMRRKYWKNGERSFFMGLSTYLFETIYS